MTEEELQPTSTGLTAVVRLDNIWEYEHFADVLFAHFNELKKRNPRFTLNGWAKKLGEKNSGNLVHFFKRRRAPTPDMTARLVTSMHLSDTEAQYFRLLVEKARGASAKNKVDAYRIQHHSQEIDLKKFAAVSSPLHFAVREILFLKDSDQSLRGIQKRLRVEATLPQIESVLKDLVNTGLITSIGDGAFIKSDDFWQTPSEIPSEAIRLYHRRSMEDYSQAIEQVPVDSRHFTSYMMSIPSASVSEAKIAIEEFINTFVARFSSPDGECDDVYQVHAILSPWSKK